MNGVQIPMQSKKTLLKASAIAAVVASVVSLCIILPAEYNIDPTGIGGALGLTSLSGDKDKSSSVSTSEPAEKIVYTTKDMSGFKEDIVLVTVPAGKGMEYKFNVGQGGKLKYSWSSVDGSPLFFDFHGEQKGGKKGYYESYTIGTAKSVKGLFTAPYDGHHGWYWKNKTGAEVQVKLTTQGDYSIVGLIGG